MNCPRCGTVYDDSFRFCPTCAQLNPYAAGSAGYPRQPPPVAQMRRGGGGDRRIWLILGIALGVVLLVGVVTALVLLLSGGGGSAAGKYRDSGGVVTLDLRSDGSWSVDFSYGGDGTGSNAGGTWKQEGNRLLLSNDDNSGTLVFLIEGDFLKDEEGLMQLHKVNGDSSSGEAEVEVTEQGSDAARRRTCQSNLRTVDGAIQSYEAFFDNPVFPSNAEDMVQPGTKVLKRIPVCPSGNAPYVWVAGSPPLISCPNDASHTI
ncbi:MAG: zinc ribbon domain-containing protein [Actinobacteria bacterium]|nr:zinc ribbon domain-containing protein [Actinomycetota bacterium]MBU1942928.1 zinc ribbon domain-containing protein [Actinomycetota bacterium]MBU2687659.1 zinc ribbon domain-containing protein [Actinomycetota bacterium]